ncbi:MAG: ABC transporter permease, partial [Alphaproteobacteria bacterium]|nr:ABC transporter permease [Alphaproteobacteria bacterium]
MSKQNAPSRFFLTNLLANTGRGFFEALEEARDMLGFLGNVSLVFGRCLLQPRRLRFTSIVHNLEQTGVNALPIVGLIAILTSIVLAYQSVTQLQKFGAEIFMIDLIGISVLREMAVLLTAIIIAGRSGSAFAAQIGTMQVGEEID